MSDQIYVATPFREEKLERIKKAMQYYLDEVGSKYHEMESGPEKQEVGMMIHDLNGAMSSMTDPTYKKPWSEFQKFFYPNSKLKL